MTGRARASYTSNSSLAFGLCTVPIGPDVQMSQRQIMNAGLPKMP